MKINGILIGLALLFFLGIITISTESWFGLSLILLALMIYMLQKPYRFVTLLFFSFLASFTLFQLVNHLLGYFTLSAEWQVLLNRFSLILIAGGLCFVHIISRQTISFFHHKPQWHNRLNLPFHSIRIVYFWLIGLLVNVAVFVPVVLMQERSVLSSLLWFSLLFSLINAVMEEWIWRGILLASLLKYTSFYYAVAVTSIGFGLLHLAIGIPLNVSLLFSLAGVIYALIVLKTNSIYPAIFLHFVINIGMVLSGWIL